MAELTEAIQEFLQQVYGDVGQKPPQFDGAMADRAEEVATTDVGEVPEGEPVEFATWIPYVGPHGGRGWQETITGEVRYQEEEPLSEHAPSLFGDEPDVKKKDSELTVPDLSSPRDEAKEALEESKSDYAYARSSGVPNAGEDLIRSARHIRNQWRGIEEAEKDGTAKEMVTLDNLLKNEPHKLLENVTPTNALSKLAAYWSLMAFPKEPGRKYHEATHEHRRQFYDAYQMIKGFVEELSEYEDPINLLRQLTTKVGDMIKHYREGDRYNPVANNLIGLLNHVSIGRQMDVRGKMRDFSNRMVQAYGKVTDENREEMLEKAVEHVQDIIEGESMNKTFDTVNKFQGEKPSDAYVKVATRIDGPDVKLESTEQGIAYMMDKLKMNGLQWGNSVTDDERKHHLKFASEAFADLMSILGLPEEMSSWGGKLGLAIGARGKGSALAHYEPSLDIINLTRKNGVGSLAHEWGHFMDHALGEGDFLSHRSYRDTVPARRMMDVQEAMRTSGFDRRLRDEIYKAKREGRLYKGQAYWGSAIEKFARTFERYIQIKLKKSDRENTYLAGLKDTDRGEQFKLWPTDEEIAAMTPALDALVKAAGEHFEGEAKEKTIYHAETKGSMVGGKPSVLVGSDADIMGKGFYFGNKDYATKYGEPKEFKIRGKLATNAQWVSALGKFKHLPIEKQRQNARMILAKEGYMGVDAGNVGVIWDQRAFHTSTEMATELATSHDIADRAADDLLRKAVREFGRFSSKVKREILDAFSRPENQLAQLDRVRQIVTRYQPELAKLLSNTQLAAALLGMKQVADKLPEIEPGVILAPEMAYLGPLTEYVRYAPDYLKDAILAGLGEDERKYIQEQLQQPPAPPGIPPVISPPGPPEPPIPLSPEGESPPTHLPLIEGAVNDLRGRRLITKAVYNRLDAEARSKAFTVAAVASEETLGKIHDSLTESLAKGETYADFKKVLKEKIDSFPFISEPHQENVFRTNIQTALSRGHDAVLRQVIEHFPYELNALIDDDRTTPLCRAVSKAGIQGTAIFRASDPWYRRMIAPRHWQCALPGTIVQGKFNVGLKSRYSGKVVEITTLRGNRLTVTRNHPILTMSGFVPAEYLHESQHLLAYTFQTQKRPHSCRNTMPKSLVSRFAMPETNKQYAPASVEDVFCAISYSCFGSTWRAPSAPDDLYGDAAYGDGEIEVVCTNGKLLLDVEAQLFEMYSNLFLSSMNGNQSTISSHGAFRDLGLAAMPTPGSFPSCGTSFYELLSRESRPLEFLSFGSAANLDTRGLKAFRQSFTSVAALYGKFFERIAGSVTPDPVSEVSHDDDFFRVKPMSFGATAYLDVGSLESSSDGANAAAEFARELVHRFPGLVAADPIVQIRNYNFSGHVYDFQSEGGWIVADNIFTSNCRCARIFLSVERAAALGIKSAEEWLRTGNPPEVPDFITPPAGVELPAGWTPGLPL